jgi:hypothetical protein
VSSTEQSTVPSLPPKERLLILAELFALTALSWLYLVRMPMSATDFGAVIVRLATPISPGLVNFWLAFIMWAVMDGCDDVTGRGSDDPDVYAHSA